MGSQSQIRFVWLETPRLSIKRNEFGPTIQTPRRIANLQQAQHRELHREWFREADRHQRCNLRAVNQLEQWSRSGSNRRPPACKADHGEWESRRKACNHAARSCNLLDSQTLETTVCRVQPTVEPTVILSAAGLATSPPAPSPPSDRVTNCNGHPTPALQAPTRTALFRRIPLV